ncbi:histidine phosphatase family protein [Clostridium sp.]|uniref:histidine phosphatase family protein n=1 Tax=Clostridium sp. TaxID=1506 RepID=UPI003F3F4039
MSKEVILYLIRHGKTKCNEERLYCGKSDVSLSERGINEIKEKINTFKYPKCKANFTSGAMRANETFKLIYPTLDYEVRKGFLEYDFGDFELKSYEMLKEDKRYIDWICDNTTEVRCPNGESRREYYGRLKNSFIEFINELIENDVDEALIVCHGGTIGTLLYLFYDSSKDLFSYQPSCGGGYKLKVILNKEIKMEILEEF